MKMGGNIVPVRQEQMILLSGRMETWMGSAPETSGNDASRRLGLDHGLYPSNQKCKCDPKGCFAVQCEAREPCRGASAGLDSVKG